MAQVATARVEVTEEGMAAALAAASSPRHLQAPVPQQKAEPSHGLKVGTPVFHNKFGEGKVLAIEGAGDDARAQVNFPRHGTKWLALSVAKLTIVD